MVSVDLGTPPAPPASVLDGLPRRLPLTLPELRLAAERAGGAPLPFEMAAATTTTPLEDRLGQARGGTEEASYAAALAALHEPSASLERRGLLVDGRLEPGLAGAIGLLATPDLAVDFDVVVEGVQVKSWQRQSDLGVATLATADGIVFELAWLPTDRWADELGRTLRLGTWRWSGRPDQLFLTRRLLLRYGRGRRFRFARRLVPAEERASTDEDRHYCEHGGAAGAPPSGAAGNHQARFSAVSVVVHAGLRPLFCVAHESPPAR